MCCLSHQQRLRPRLRHVCFHCNTPSSQGGGWGLTRQLLTPHPSPPPPPPPPLSHLLLSADIKWASRWDTYLRSADGVSIQWFSIINSLVIVLFLSGMLGIILVRTLYKDIARYNQVGGGERGRGVRIAGTMH